MTVAPTARRATICMEDNPATFIPLTNIPIIPHKHAAIIMYAEPTLSFITKHSYYLFYSSKFGKLPLLSMVIENIFVSVVFTIPGLR